MFIRVFFCAPNRHVSISLLAQPRRAPRVLGSVGVWGGWVFTNMSSCRHGGFVRGILLGYR